MLTAPLPLPIERPPHGHGSVATLVAATRLTSCPAPVGPPHGALPPTLRGKGASQLPAHKCLVSQALPA